MTPSQPRKAALAIIDMQEDFCEPHGSLAIKDGREIAPIINDLMERPGFTLRIATRDFHPRDHISFASNHFDKSAFTSTHTITNPENEDETQTTLLWPDHCVQNTRGCHIIPELRQEKLSHIIDKGIDPRCESYSGFGPPFRKPEVSMTALRGILETNGITDIYIVGLAYDFCVKHTALDAVEFGYKTFVIEDATKSATESAEGACQKELEECGVVMIRSDSEHLP